MRPLRSLLVPTMLLLLVPSAAAQEAPVGQWHGAINIMGQQLSIQVDFSWQNDSLGATIDIPQQGAQGLPLQNVRYGAPDVHFELPAGPGLAVFDGTLTRGDSTHITGDFEQAGTIGTFHLTPGPLETQRRRPQEPEKPYPYEADSVTFANEDAGVTLAGTLTRPRGDGPFPAVVLISGSGPQDRNGEIAGHKPFLVLADYLTRRGIAVLRYDDRGVPQSTGSFKQAITEDFTADARAAVDFLSTRTDIGDIGLIGHSEGGLVAPMVANASDRVDFVVLLAGPGVPGADLLARQNALLFERMGMSAEGAAAYEQRMRDALDRVVALSANQPMPDSVRAALRADFTAAAEAMSPSDRAVYGPTDSTAFAQVLDRMMGQLSQPWMRSFLRHDPRPALRKLDVPVLALMGENDFQVLPDQNMPPMREALETSPTSNYTIKEMPELNHLLQPSKTGLPSEYSQIEQTIAPKALKTIGDWIQAHVE